jgi:TRAP-type C4-dicarboxylate transport system permease small subunit
VLRADAGGGWRPASASRATKTGPMNRLSLVAASLAGFGLLSMALLGVSDVIGTQFLRQPVPGTVELSKALMVFSIMLGVAKAEADGKHIRVAIATDRLPLRMRRIINLLAPLSMAVLFAAIAWGGWDMLRQSIANREYDEGLIQLPLWPARLALAIGATMMVAQCLINLRRGLRRAVDPPDQPLAPL